MISVATLSIEFMLLYFFRLDGTENPGWLYTVMIILFTLAFSFDIARSKKLSFARGALLVGYFWRIFLLYLDIYGKSIYSLPNSGADSVGFFREAVAFAATGNPEVAQFFPRVMGSLFKFIGNSQLYGQFIILLTSVVSLVLFAWLLAELKLDYSVKQSCILLISLLPNYGILSVLFLRESPVTMLITLSVFFLFFWLKRGRTICFLFSFIFSLVASLFHGGSIAVTIGLIVIRILYNRKNEDFHSALRNLIPALLFSIIVIYLYLNHGDKVFTKVVGVDSISEIGNTRAEGGSSYAQFVGDSATPVNLLIYTIPRILYFLFSPFPWQWRGLSDIIAFLFSSAFYFAALWRCFHYLKSGEKLNRVFLISLLIIAAFTTFVFAWGVSNTGTATRHRDKMIIIFGLIYSISYLPKKTKLPSETSFTLRKG